MEPNLSREELETEAKRIRGQMLGVGAGAVIVLIGGAVFYHYVEHFSWLDAFYFCTITLTTIGYGDIAPKTDLGKIFTIFYVIIGIGFLGAFANLLIKNALSRRQLKKNGRRSHPDSNVRN